jgi:acyl-CoA synthetase (AMP-forming)/AMP-acid ligase II
MTVAAPPKVEFMTDAVAHWAAAQPDAEALTYRETRWTWAQWNDRIGRAAGGLAAAAGWRSWTRTTRRAWRCHWAPG